MQPEHTKHPDDKARGRSGERPPLHALGFARKFCGTQNRGTDRTFSKVEHLDLRRREAVCAHSTIHTEPIRNSQREKAGDDGERQGKLGHDWVL